MVGDLDFSDLFLGDKGSFFRGLPNQSDPFVAPQDLNEDLDQLRIACKEAESDAIAKGKTEFAVRYDNVSYRVQPVQTMGEYVFILRKFPSTIPLISELGIHPGVISQLLETKQSGLVVISGAYGQGKTTTASAYLTALLSQFGGVALTIEDPPEMPLQGWHGKGYAYQTWAVQGGFAQECRKAARCAPSIIFLGEIRDSETASEALRAALNGRMVICTVHADSVVTTIERLYALANGGEGKGNSDDMAQLLSQGLSVVIHQRLEGMPRKPKVEFLFVGDDAGTKNMIKNKAFNQLSSVINLQLNRLMRQCSPSP